MQTIVNFRVDIEPLREIVNEEYFNAFVVCVQMYELQFKHTTTYIEKYKEIANNKFADLFEVALHEKCIWKLNCIKFSDW